MVVTESDNACVGYIALSLARRMIDFVGRCGYGRRAAMDAFMSGAAEGEKGLPVGRGGKTVLPDGYSQIFRLYVHGPFGLLDCGSATLRCII